MRSHPSTWQDMSNYVVHFTQGGTANADYKNMLSIYGQGKLLPKNPFGIGRRFCPDENSQRAVCFSEIPPGQWDRLKNRRETSYGIGFTKEFIVENGGGPVWYVYKDSPSHIALTELMRNEEQCASAAIWKITPFIDAPGSYGGREYFFEWEREWRLTGELEFKPEDVAFLLLSEELHGAAGAFFEMAVSEPLGPGYFCPYVDPTWDRDRILETINSGIEEVDV